MFCKMMNFFLFFFFFFLQYIMCQIKNSVFNLTIFILNGHDGRSLIWINSNGKRLLYVVAWLKYDREILRVLNLEVCVDHDAHSLLQLFEEKGYKARKLDIVRIITCDELNSKCNKLKLINQRNKIAQKQYYLLSPLLIGGKLYYILSCDK